MLQISLKHTLQMFTDLSLAKELLPDINTSHV